MAGFETDEMLNNFRYDKKNNIFAIIVSCIGIVCMGVSLMLYIGTEKQVKRYKEIYEEKQYYSVLDNLYGEDEDKILGDDGLARMRDFLNQLQNSEYWDYYMMYSQSVYVENYIGKETGIYGYEKGMDVEQATIDLKSEDGSVSTYTDIKGFWIGKNVMEDFCLDISDGHGFVKNDFLLTDDTISVVLGNEFKEDYKLGDLIHIDFVFEERDAKVIGFLKEGSNIYYHGNYLNLDRYFIMPMFENDTYNGKDVFRVSTNYFYTLRNSGTIATKLAVNDVESEINRISNDVGFSNGYYVKEYDETTQKTFGFGIEEIRFLIIVISLLVILVAMLILTYLLKEKINRNKKYYAILLINGCSKRQIINVIIKEFGVIYLLAYFIGLSFVAAIMGFLKESGFFLITLCLLCGGIIWNVIPLSVSIMTFLKTDLITYLKEEI